ncbi:MAG: PAS domain S-box protein, partial [Rhodoferax sp.]
MNLTTFQRHSLKTRVTLFTLVIFLVSIWSLQYIASRMLHRDMEQSLGEQQFSTVALIADEINADLADRLRALERIAEATEQAMLDNPAALRTSLEGRLLLQGFFNGGVFVAGVDGVVIASTQPLMVPPGLSVGDRDYMIAALKEGRTSIGQPVLGRQQSLPILAMAAPIRNARTQVIGAVVGVTSLSLPNFLDRISQNRYGKSGNYLLVAGQHRLIVTASEKSRVMEILPKPGINQKLDRFINGYEGTDTLVNPLGVEVFTAVKHVPIAAWYVAATLPTADAFAPVHALLQRTTGAAVLLTLLAGGLIWLMLRRQLEPLQATARTLATWSDGKQTLHPLPVTRQDEIGQLITGFNRLLADLGQRQEWLKLSESRFRTMFSEAPMGIALIGSLTGHIYEVNPMFARISGRSVEEMTGIDWMSITHPDDVRQDLDQLALMNAGRIASFQMEKRFLRKDGELAWIDMRIAPIYVEDSAHPRHICMIEDISERKRNEETVREKSEQLRLLYGASQRLNRTLDLDEIYRAINDFISVIAPNDSFSISAFDPDTQLIACRAYFMDKQPVDVGAFPSIPLEAQGQGTQSIVIRSGQPLLIGDYQARVKTAKTSYFVDDQTHELVRQVDPEEEVIQSALIVPLKVGGQVTGVIQVMSCRPNAYTEDQLKLLESLALHAASAEQNAILFAKMQFELAERKVAEAALREREQLLRESQRAANIGSYINHLEAGTFECTAALDDIFGITGDYPHTNQGWLDFMHPDFTEVLQNALSESVQNKKPFDSEYKIIRPRDGAQRWMHGLGEIAYDHRGKAVSMVGTVQDITERKVAEEQLRKLSLAIEQSPNSIVITDIASRIEYVNDAFVKVTGYSREEAVGQTPHILQSGKTPSKTYVRMWQALGKGKVWKGEFCNRTKNGREFDEFAIISPLRQSDGRVTHYVAVKEDLTERKAAEEQIQSLAFSDLLTGLPNRRMLIVQLQQVMIASEHEKRQVALLLVDLDHFKNLNDALGHEKGDLLLLQFALRLSACVNEGGTVARLGGDEFVVILTQLDQSPLEAAMHAETVANRILNLLRQPYQIDGSEISCNASIGITLFGDRHEDTSEPLKRAELAMYQAKAHGRNTLCFFDPDMQAVVNSRVALEAGLREAIETNQFLLHYQPQVTDQGKITGVEALLRWPDPKRGMRSPAEFIPLAEETGLILPIGNWVLETACKQLARWATMPAMAHLTVAVNVSTSQFHQRDFVDQVLSTLHRTGSNPNRLKLELTESVLVTDVAGVIAKMSALRGRGVTFSLDDFGTGYSSLSYLKRLPLD